MLNRHLTPALLAALGDTPVVLLNGARQTGKSTLVRALAQREHPARYLTLDDPAVLAAAHGDPAGFLAGLAGPVIIDEVQRAPELFVPLKAQVDRDRRPGRFLLTGSANVLLLPRLAETLVGRMEILTLEPFSQGELEGTRESFVERAFAEDWVPRSAAPVESADLVRRVLAGGYPEAVRRTCARRRAWYDSYASTLLQRDVQDLSRIEGVSTLPRLLALLAARSGGLFNAAELSRSSGLPQSTLQRYLALLEATFLFRRLPAWSANLSKRLVRSPKVLLNDSGLTAYLVGHDDPAAAAASAEWGALVEGFVINEIYRQVTWSERRPRLFHFRTQGGSEVDLVLEDRAGRLVALEVKSGAAVGTHDFAGLRALAEQTGSRFVRGLVLYGGREVIPHGPRLHAAPLSLLWGTS